MPNDSAKTTAESELLAEMYRNVKMGSENLATVVPMVKNRTLLTGVTSQLEEYAAYENKTASLLRKRAIRPEEPSFMKKTMSRGGILMNTLFDSSDAHIADMIVKGTAMGADQLEEKMHELRSAGCGQDVTDLCREIVSYERKTVNRMKDFT